MSVERYRFQCTDGRDAMFDRAGQVVRSSELIPWHAERVAFSLMEGCSDEPYWSDWIVEVHDDSGRRFSTIGFDEIRQQRQQHAA